jgi:hypothetical protein
MILNHFQKKRNLHGSMKAMIDCTANKYDTYYEYHFAKLALIHKLKLPISQGDQVSLVMGGLEDERIKIAIETSNINTPEVLAAHFRVLDEKRLGRSKPKTYTNTQSATGAEKYKASSSSARFPKNRTKLKTVPSLFSQLALNVVAGAIFVGSAPVTTIMTSDQLLNALCWRLNRNTSIS